ncbi:MAG: hypothetical protein JKY51_03015 [Opitutaceae bacterium]|nr:hypothetical protein [Opitutaceae bacterium]
MKAQTKIKIILGITSLAFLASVISLIQFFLKYIDLDLIVSLVTFVTLLAFAASEYRSGAPKTLDLRENLRFRTTAKRQQPSV